MTCASLAFAVLTDIGFWLIFAALMAPIVAAVSVWAWYDSIAILAKHPE